MTEMRQRVAAAQAGLRAAMQSGRVFLADVGNGLLEVSHNTLALVGFALVALVLFGASRADVRSDVETEVLGWLKARQVARVEGTSEALLIDASPDAIERATATDPKELKRDQAAVAQWLSRRYRVAPEPVSRLVQEAWAVGQKVNLDPTLILAVMAIESGFNPFAQSPVGAQGLMQVMTHVHDDKYERFGGTHAAFDPVTNLHVGVLVLKECIARAGSLEGGLRYYVGAANLSDDGGYTWKVQAEQQHLRAVARGQAVAINAPLSAPPAAATKPPAAADAPALDTPATAKPPTAQKLALLN